MRRLPRSNLYLNEGADLRERLRYDRFILPFEVPWLMGVFAISYCATEGEIWFRSISGASSVVAWVGMALAMWASKAVPFFHRYLTARLFLVGFPVFIGLLVAGEILLERIK